VTITELPDYYAAGETEAEAWANYRDAFVALIKAYRATGTTIPEPAPVLPRARFG
jgi:predicted RNase H-like HicB family nuclease